MGIVDTEIQALFAQNQNDESFYLLSWEKSEDILHAEPAAKNVLILVFAVLIVF